jgi:hypothetical protein
LSRDAGEDSPAVLATIPRTSIGQPRAEYTAALASEVTIPVGGMSRVSYWAAFVNTPVIVDVTKVVIAISP